MIYFYCSPEYLLISIVKFRLCRKHNYRVINRLAGAGLPGSGGHRVHFVFRWAGDWAVYALEMRAAAPDYSARRRITLWGTLHILADWGDFVQTEPAATPGKSAFCSTLPTAFQRPAVFLWPLRPGERLLPQLEIYRAVYRPTNSITSQNIACPASVMSSPICK